MGNDRSAVETFSRRLRERLEDNADYNDKVGADGRTDFLPESAADLAVALGISKEQAQQYIRGAKNLNADPDEWGRYGGTTKLEILLAVLPTEEICVTCKLPREYHKHDNRDNTDRINGVKCAEVALARASYKAAVATLKRVGVPHLPDLPRGL